MNINGRWYTETEAQAYIITLEHKNAALEDKHLSECRQISEYDAENKALRKLLTQVSAYYGETESWVDLYEEKAVKLLGKDIDAPATEGDTNVGCKSGGWISYDRFRKMIGGESDD